MVTDENRYPVYLQDGRIKAPECINKNGYVDDFKDGISPLRWRISDRKWGPLADYQGVCPENISYTEDGILLLKGQGLYSTDRPLSGAALVSAEPHGAGSYSAAMKVLPRMGVCNAMWTYFQSDKGLINHEIDIELPGHITEDGSRSDPGYRRVLNTNWLSTTNYTSTGVITDTPANDGKWHLYRFDWHIKPVPHIDFYVDGVLTSTTTEKVPFRKGLFWLGVWLPKGWCGVADFEEDYMMIDWVSYQPFDEEETLDTFSDPGKTASLEAYPGSPVLMPETNLISNRGFEGNFRAYNISAVGASVVTEFPHSGNRALKLENGGYAYQSISAVYEGMRYDFEVFAKCASGTGSVHIEFYNLADKRIEDTGYVITINETDYKRNILEIAAPADCRKLVVRLCADKDSVLYFDDLSLKIMP